MFWRGECVRCVLPPRCDYSSVSVPGLTGTLRRTVHHSGPRKDRSLCYVNTPAHPLRRGRGWRMGSLCRTTAVPIRPQQAWDKEAWSWTSWFLIPGSCACEALNVMILCRSSLCDPSLHSSVISSIPPGAEALPGWLVSWPGSFFNVIGSTCQSCTVDGRSAPSCVPLHNTPCLCISLDAETLWTALIFKCIRNRNYWYFETRNF